VAAPAATTKTISELLESGDEATAKVVASFTLERDRVKAGLEFKL
jgi:hypothetical protein